MLGGTPLDDSQSAGAIAVSVTLRPGQTTVIPFALTWDFPQVTMNNNRTVWMRRYTEFYGARMTGPADAAPGGYNTYLPGSYPFHQRRQIAVDALASADQTLQAVQSWWAPLAAIGRCRPSSEPRAGPARAGHVQDLDVGGRIRVIDRVPDAGPPAGNG